MQLTKSYHHFYQADLPQTDIKVEAVPKIEAPSPAPKTFTEVDTAKETEATPMPPVKSSIIPKLIIIFLILLIAVLIYRLYPKSYNDCASLPGSQVDNGTCTTFWRQQFLNGAVDVTTTPEAVPTTINAYLPLISPTLAPAQTAGTATTKGGLSPEPTVKSVGAAPPTPTALAPVPTTAPGDTTKPSDWVKHRYPDQKISFWLPKGWTGSDAAYNRDTLVTTFNLGGTNSLIVTLHPHWANTGNANTNPQNYQVKGNTPAIKITGAIYTSVYFEHAGQVYQLSCHNSLWNTCHPIFQNLELTP